MDGRIKVDTNVLLAQADTVSSLISKVSEAFADMKSAVNNTNAYWIGEAGNAHREKYTSKQGRIDEAIRRLNENVTDLRVMSGVYSEAEAQAMREAEALVTAVIS